MEGPPRTPPRFVPTLTAVVDLQDEAASVSERAAAPEPEPPAAGTAESPVAPVSTAPLDALDGRPQPPVLTEAFAAPPQFEPLSRPAPTDGPAPRVEPAFDAWPPEPAPHEAAPPEPPPSMRALTIDEAEAFRLEEELLHRVLQRVDLSLEDRLTEIVSAAVQQQLDAMVPRLRQSVEAALRELVVEAMAHELSETPGSAAHSRTRLDLN